MTIINIFGRIAAPSLFVITILILKPSILIFQDLLKWLIILLVWSLIIMFFYHDFVNPFKIYESGLILRNKKMFYIARRKYIPFEQIRQIDIEQTLDDRIKFKIFLKEANSIDVLVEFGKLDAGLKILKQKVQKITPDITDYLNQSRNIP